MTIIEAYLKYLNEFDPIITPLVGAGIGASMFATNIIRSRKKRKQCMTIADTIKNKEKRKEALVRCLQGGN